MKQIKDKKIILSFFAGLAALMVLFVTYFLIYKNYFPLTSFSDRIISAATVKGVDISKQIVVYSVGLSIAGIFVYLLFRGFFKVFSPQISPLIQRISNKRILWIIAIFGAALLALYNLWSGQFDQMQFLIYILLFVFTLVFILSSTSARIKKLIPHLIDVCFYFSLFYSALLCVSSLFGEGIWLKIALVIVLVLSVLLPIRLTPKNRVLVYALPTAYLLTDLMFFRFGISSVILFAVKVLLLLGTTIVSFLPVKVKFLKKRHKSLCYCFLIVGLAFVGMGGYSITYTPDYFEYANHAISIDGLLHFGYLPILETFDAHMLSDQLPGFLYYVLVGNANDAALLGSAWEGVNLSFYYIFAFLLLTKFVHKDKALIMILFLPKTCFGLDYLPFALWVTILLIQNNRRILYLIYWLVMIFSVPFRLDSGLCCICACVSMMLLYLIQSKDFGRLRRFLLSFIFVAVPIVIIILGICVLKDINVLSLIQRFLQLTSKSNQNWAYGVFGYDTIKVLCVYYVMNTLCAALLVSIIINCFCKKKNVLPKHYIVSTAGIAWFTNLSRTIVRHNAVEWTPTFLLCCAIFFVLLLVVSARKFMEWRTVLCLTICAAMLISGSPLIGNLGKIQCSQSVNDTYPTATTESRLSFDISFPIRFTEIIDELLEENETFYDFSNTGLLFTLSGRENPVYENQSPGLLSGERAQQITIDELEAKKDTVACALLPAGNLLQNKVGLSVSIDGVYNEDRYYLVSEYLYRNFVPILRWGDYDIWMKKQLAKQRSNRLTSLGAKSDISLLSDISTKYFDGKTHQMGAVPYLWANADENSKTEKRLICRLIENNGSYQVSLDARDNEHGNYIRATINSQQDGIGSLILNYDNVQEQYDFDIRKGTNDYLFRISSNYKWYISSRILLTIGNLDKKQKVENVSVLTGDVLNTQ